MKLHVVAIALLVSTVTSFAQGPPGFDKMTLGAYGIVSLPVGDFGDIAGTGFGGGARFQYGVDVGTVFTASAGYVTWGEQDLIASTTQSSAWEILVGGKYYFTPGLFGLLEGGVNIFTVEATITNPITGSKTTGDESTARFMLPFGVGYQHEEFEVTAKYYLFHPDATTFGFTLGYNFRLQN